MKRVLGILGSLILWLGVLVVLGSILGGYQKDTLVVAIIVQLLLLAGGIGATTATVHGARSGTASWSAWLEANGWGQAVSTSCRALAIYINNAARQLAIFRQGTKEPERVLSFDNIAGCELYQQSMKEKSTVQLTIQLVNGQPYVIPVTDRPLPPDSPELAEALAFAKRVNDLLNSMAQGAGGVQGGAGKRYVVAKCYNCGQLLHGEAGRSGWCPKCDAAVRMPDYVSVIQGGGEDKRQA